MLAGRILLVEEAAVYPLPARILVLFKRPKATRLVKKAEDSIEAVLVPL